MCIAKDRPPELVVLVEALTLRKGVFQLKGRLLKAVRSELRAAKESGLTWRVIWGDSVSSSDYSVYVDATTGTYLEKAH